MTNKRVLESLIREPAKFQSYVRQRFAQINRLEEERYKFPQYQHKEARKHDKLNRYSDIVPYDGNCIKLKDTRLGSGHDGYINASWIIAPHDIPRVYIATQGPTPNTLIDFWRLVLEQHVPVIVCLTAQMDGKIEKCARYWPVGDQVLEFIQQDVTVKVSNIKQERQDAEADCILRTISVGFYRHDELIQEARVTQLQFLGWPDHGVPNQTAKVIGLVRLTRQLQETNKPVLVHCSAGCGRTGTFCVIDTAEVLLRTHPDFSLDPVFFLTDEFRKQRTTMVQAEAQYSFCYKALLDFIEEEK
ncbi:protein tyrosine phosphatase, non-receptor type 12 [Rhizopus stolonifer]|uniref:protein-tyrosine-phosphatase n=1 Tax=Rhizopus stolonifer TaxID=4846 RepID=A0A367IX99_RHIST|nr:protein tyrosine phosphatase, non-receptor type 12 [Rhizopus stolonifer]